MKAPPNLHPLIRLVCVASLIPACCGQSAAGESATASEPASSQAWNLADAASRSASVTVGQMPKDVQPLAMMLILEALPENYENRKKWGRTREVWDGLHVRFDDGKIKTKRRKKSVNHGTWTRYQLKLVEPEKNVRVETTKVRKLESGAAGFDLKIEAKLEVLAQAQEWNRGVKLVSVSTEAVADVRLILACTLATRVDITVIPPDLILDPQVTSAELQLADLKLKRISNADGPLVRELSWSVEQVVRDHINERNSKLTAKINRQIDKHRDDLRFSSSRFVREKFFGSGPASP